MSDKPPKSPPIARPGDLWVWCDPPGSCPEFVLVLDIRASEEDAGPLIWNTLVFNDPDEDSKPYTDVEFDSDFDYHDDGGFTLLSRRATE